MDFGWKDGLVDRFRADLDLDFSVALSEPDQQTTNRFRANVFRSHGNLCGCFRHIPRDVPSFEWMGFPKATAEQIVNLNNGLVIITGITGSGKTTIAYALEQKLFGIGIKCFVLDGENARLGFSSDLSFTADDRGENIRRAAEVARLLNEAGLVAICAFLSPYEQNRALAEKIIGKENFIEVYLSAPIDVCRKRDISGIYELAESGQIKNFSGITSPYEKPKSPDLTLPTGQLEVADCVDRIVSHIDLL